jgi:hypothetical protein
VVQLFEEYRMRKLVPLALAACLGIAAASISVPAEAGVAISVGIPVPGVAVAAPPVVAPWPYYYAGPRYYYVCLVEGAQVQWV